MLLAPDPTLAAGLGTLATMSRAHGVGYRLGETNSFANGGQVSIVNRLDRETSGIVVLANSADGKVHIVVAITKTDVPGANVDKVKGQLQEKGLMPEDWGGDVVMVPVSAKAKQNLDLLLEMILLVAEMQNLRANPARPATGNVLEAKLDKGRGPVATVLVQRGTLHVGDSIRDDYEGARAAGLNALLLDRRDEHGHVSERIRSLSEIPARL